MTDVRHWKSRLQEQKKTFLEVVSFLRPCLHHHLRHRRQHLQAGVKRIKEDISKDEKDKEREENFWDTNNDGHQRGRKERM